MLRSILAWDDRITLALNLLCGAPPSRAWELVWQLVSLGGTAAIALPVSAAAWEGRDAGRRRFATRATIALAAVGIAAAVTTLVVKPIFARPRPAAALAGVHVVGDPILMRGFPSGHATAAGAGAAAIVLLARRRRWLIAAAITGAGFVGLSRVALGHHFLLDVLAGLLLGAIVATPFAAWGLRRAGVLGPLPGAAPPAPPIRPPPAPPLPETGRA